MAQISCRKCGAVMSDTDPACPVCRTGPSSWSWIRGTFRRDGLGNSRLDALITITIVATVVVMALLVLALFEVARSAAHALALPSTRLGWSDKTALIVIMLLVAASATFVRQNYRAVYGMTEIAFAIATAWRVLGAEFQENLLANVVVLFGLVYLAGRGMVNIAEGTKWRPLSWEEYVTSLFLRSKKQ